MRLSWEVPLACCGAALHQKFTSSIPLEVAKEPPSGGHRAAFMGSARRMAAVRLLSRNLLLQFPWKSQRSRIATGIHAAFMGSAPRMLRCGSSPEIYFFNSPGSRKGAAQRRASCRFHGKRPSHGCGAAPQQKFTSSIPLEVAKEPHSDRHPCGFHGKCPSHAAVRLFTRNLLLQFPWKSQRSRPAAGIVPLSWEAPVAWLRCGSSAEIYFFNSPGSRKGAA